MPKKRMFQILDEMNVMDVANNTGTVSLANSLVETKLSKQGGLITMGVDRDTFNRITFNDGSTIVVLMVIDRKTYDSLSNPKEDDSTHRTQPGT